MDSADVQVVRTMQPPACSCGRAADSLCSCKFPATPLLPLCSLCSMQHFASERGDHHQLPVQAYHFVTSVSSFREAIMRITRYEAVKRKLDSNALIAQQSDTLLSDAAAKLISTIQQICNEGQQALKQTKQAVVHGRDRIIEQMEWKLFEPAPYFPSVEETELFRFDLGLEAVERALENFGKVPRSKFDMDLSDIMKTEEEREQPQEELPQKPRKPPKPLNRRNKLDRIFQIALPPNKVFKCHKHKDVFWSAKALVKHLRHKHEKFRADMMPSDLE